MEEFDFQRRLGKKGNSVVWQYHNRKFEYEDILQDVHWPWGGHRYFAYDLVRNIKPQTIVELGTYRGTSFFSFCQAVKDANYDARLCAVDTWKGDKHSEFYGEEVFDGFKNIVEKHYYNLNIKTLRKSFDEAVEEIDDNSIDLLHVDGLHTYAAVKHDFETWLPKVKKQGIILMHDIFISKNDYGVYKVWEELKNEYKTIEFYHSCGLGVLFKDYIPFSDFINQERELQIRYSSLDMDKKNEERVGLLMVHNAQIADLNQQIEGIVNSMSWRLTRPLRYFHQKLLSLREKL